MMQVWLRPERSFPLSETAIRERALAGHPPETLPPVNLDMLLCRPVVPVGHGTRSGYNQGCRCHACTAANRAAGREAQRIKAGLNETLGLGRCSRCLSQPRVEGRRICNRCRAYFKTRYEQQRKEARHEQAI